MQMSLLTATTDVCRRWVHPEMNQCIDKPHGPGSSYSILLRLLLTRCRSKSLSILSHDDITAESPSDLRGSDACNRIHTGARTHAHTHTPGHNYSAYRQSGDAMFPRWVRFESWTVTSYLGRSWLNARRYRAVSRKHTADCNPVTRLQTGKLFDAVRRFIANSVASRCRKFSQFIDHEKIC